MFMPSHELGVRAFRAHAKSFNHVILVFSEYWASISYMFSTHRDDSSYVGIRLSTDHTVECSLEAQLLVSELRRCLLCTLRCSLSHPSMNSCTYKETVERVDHVGSPKVSIYSGEFFVTSLQEAMLFAEVSIRWLALACQLHTDLPCLLCLY